jgi:hypothetical protein
MISEITHYEYVDLPKSKENKETQIVLIVFILSKSKINYSVKKVKKYDFFESVICKYAIYKQNLESFFDIIFYQQSKMFFGKILSQGQNFKFNPHDAEESQGEVLSITNVVLAPSSKESVSLYVKKENVEFLIATVTKENPHVVINLFVSLLD